MAFEKGHTKVGGNVAGVPAKKKEGRRSASQILADENWDPIMGNIRIARGDVPCGVCHGAGVTQFQPKTKTFRGDDGTVTHYREVEGPDGKERVCQSCWGSKLERISPELKFKSNDMLAKYCHPTLKQMEISGPEGGPLSLSLSEVVRERRAQRLAIKDASD